MSEEPKRPEAEFEAFSFGTPITKEDLPKLVEHITSQIGRSLKKAQWEKAFKTETEQMTMEQKLERLRFAFSITDECGKLFGLVLALANNKDFRELILSLSEHATDEHQSMIQMFLNGVDAGAAHLQNLDTLGADRVVDWARWLTSDDICACPGCIEERANEYKDEQKSTQSGSE